MTYKAEIDVMPLKELLDPQGKAVLSGFHNLHLEGILDARIGKHITLTIDAKDKNEALDKVELACKKLLANQVIEYFTYTVEEAG
jgi:phosphoribosylformylglycinamidine synthase subunit PurS